MTCEFCEVIIYIEVCGVRVCDLLIYMFVIESFPESLSCGLKVWVSILVISEPHVVKNLEEDRFHYFNTVG